MWLIICRPKTTRLWIVEGTSAIIRLAPPISPPGRFSSAGWNRSLMVPTAGRGAPASTSAAAIRMAVWQSWPRHAEPAPRRHPSGRARAKQKGVHFFGDGNASISARSATTGPGPPPPLKVATIPVTANFPSRHSLVRASDAQRCWRCGLPGCRFGVLVAIATPADHLGSMSGCRARRWCIGRDAPAVTTSAAKPRPFGGASPGDPSFARVSGSGPAEFAEPRWGRAGRTNLSHRRRRPRPVRHATESADVGNRRWTNAFGDKTAHRPTKDHNLNSPVPNSQMGRPASRPDGEPTTPSG